jgi:hypothetical protein
MAEKHNQGIQNQKRVHQCTASFAFLADWVHERDGPSSAPASSKA